MAETRLKIAVFIDFDNIEIGVKTTLGGHFDVGAVLEAIKERGEVVTKIAYGDWTRAGDYSRSLTQHAIHMVQRNLTPGGDKNGADINLALDALEMAFTHSHINAFVIVGGDSDFMALVEKLKQYDRKVFVVGGRAFTSTILQRNCTEFIAYENLVGASARKTGRGGRAGEASVEKAVPLIRRALKVLADREVSPQLGVLKSTLLQLDSTFSEREYGASTFRDFVQRLARGGYVTLKGTERNIYVELRDGDGAAPAPAALTAARDGEPQVLDAEASGAASASLAATSDADAGATTSAVVSGGVTGVETEGLPAASVASAAAAPAATPVASHAATSSGRPLQRVTDEPRQTGGSHAGGTSAGATQSSAAASTASAGAGAAVQEPGERGERADRGERGERGDRGDRGERSDRGERGGHAPAAGQPGGGSAGSAVASASQADLLRLVLDVFQRPGAVSRWPLYLRQVKQLLRTADDSFDERRYGFSGIVEALRFCQREGVFRLDRDRQGVLRVFPGPVLQRTAQTGGQPEQDPADSHVSADAPASEPTAQTLFPASDTADQPRATDANPGADTAGDAVDSDPASSARAEADSDAPSYESAADSAPGSDADAAGADGSSADAVETEAAEPVRGAAKGRKRSAKSERPAPERTTKSARANKGPKAERPVKKTAAAAKAAPARNAKATRGGRKNTK